MVGYAGADGEAVDVPPWSMLPLEYGEPLGKADIAVDCGPCHDVAGPSPKVTGTRLNASFGLH